MPKPRSPRVTVLALVVLCLGLSACGSTSEQAKPTVVVSSQAVPLSLNPSQPSVPESSSDPATPADTATPSGPTTSRASADSATPRPPAPPSTPSASSSATSRTPVTPQAGPTRKPTLPVYWLRTSADNAWLYREFREITVRGNADIEQALRTVMSTQPPCEGCTSLWRAPSRVQVQRHGNAIAIDLSADAFGSRAPNPRAAERSIQQLVWTATGVAQSTGPVTITVDGKPFTAWGAVQLGMPVERDTNARAPIWVDTPWPGAVYHTSTVTITGTARTAEGTVQIQIVPAEVAGAKPLVTTFTNAGADVYASYRKVVNIKPGRYVLHVYEQDTSDGEGAAPNGRLFQVSIPFTVTG